MGRPGFHSLATACGAALASDPEYFRGEKGGGVLQCQYAVPTAVFLSLIFETQALLLLYVLIMCMQVYAGLACPEQSPLTLRILTVPGLEQHPILSTNISRVHIVIGRC